MQNLGRLFALLLVLVGFFVLMTGLLVNQDVVSITEQDRLAIVNRRVYTQGDPPADTGMVFRLGGGVAMFLGAFGYWTLRLRSLNQALRESEREKSVLLSNLPGMAYRCRFDRAWTMEFVSDGCKELTGWKSGDLKDNRVVSYQKLIHPDDVETVWQHWQVASRTPEKPVCLEYRLKFPDGKEKWVLEHGVFLLNENGIVQGIEGLLIDVTDRKELEFKQKQMLDDLKKSFSEIRTLRGMIPICASCKKIRDDAGYWSQVDAYVTRHTHAEFTHGICPDCMKEFYADVPENPRKS